MNTLTRGKILLYLAVIFTAGGITGAVTSYSSAERHRRPPSPQHACESIRKRLQTRLDLTPDQQTKIEPLIQETVGQMEEVHRKSAEQIEQIFDRLHSQIDADLTPEQRIKLKELANERHEFWRKRLGQAK